MSQILAFKELAKQAEELNLQIWTIAKGVFEKMQDDGLVREEHHVDGEYVMEPVNGYQFSKYELEKAGIELVGEYYFRGESDYVRVTVPYEAVDNIDAYIVAEQAKIAEAAHLKAEAKAATAAKEQAEHEEWERNHYLELKAKYEGVPLTDGVVRSSIER